MDVHPPLGKMMIAAAGALAGFDGVFKLREVGLDYLEVWTFLPIMKSLLRSLESHT